MFTLLVNVCLSKILLMKIQEKYMYEHFLLKNVLFRAVSLRSTISIELHAKITEISLNDLKS